ncbi:hypothetical protein [uncultured Lamprocystis sp.]|jgi:phage tail protein X|uniref:hypothetical protein n=1 Tax=uncultured Lamprocystis sp. TaxID=543132 RepID=UPI0025DC80C4|nr:hypothetical protein [uncultured Lamprocystis sp.]
MAFVSQTYNGITYTTFDEAYYLSQNPDVLAAVRNGIFQSALQHYVLYGEGEGRMPNVIFSPTGYLTENTDVLAAVSDGVFQTGLQHFEQFGAVEDRSPGDDLFNEANYMDENPDVAAAVAAGVFTSGYQHYILHGQSEGRSPGVASPDFTLTDGIDHLTANIPNATFDAPIVQNMLGALTNTFESGDVLRGAGGTNVLRADLMASASTTIPVGPAISATTTDIQQVYFRAQTINTDVAVNWSNVDAEQMIGVEQWWSDNSRSSVRIEDIRSIPEQTTFGMRETDAVPGGLGGVAGSGTGAGLFAYFSPDFVSRDRFIDENSSLTLILVDAANPDSLEGFPVDGVVFDFNGETFTVALDLGTGAERTYENLVTVLNAGLAADPALAGLGAVLNADNSVTITDPDGGTFVPGGYTWINDVVPPAGVLNWDLIAGAPSPVEVPTETSVVLDFVGRTSQGGVLDIGSMADGGVKIFNVSVDRESWLTRMQSSSDFGNGILSDNFIDDIHGRAEQNLETVNLASIGANGDLTVGVPVADDQTGTLDGIAYDGAWNPRVRVEAGLIDVRTVDGADFAGRLNLGILLTEDSNGRYLTSSTEEVEFNYTASAQDDIFTVQVDGFLSEDPDFAMNVLMGDGNDRLNLGAWTHINDNDLTANQIVVDGGTGDNTIAVNSNFGTTAGNTFENFSNFQTYEIEGFRNTSHDFQPSMLGVETVLIVTENEGLDANPPAIPAGVDTTLIDLEDGTSVTVSGRNQTLDNNSNDNQAFGAISFLGADAETLDLVVENASRADGILVIDYLNIDDNGLDESAVRTLNLYSNVSDTVPAVSERNQSNVVQEFDGRGVTTLNLLGSQDLSILVDEFALSDGPVDPDLTIDGSALTGDLTLAINEGNRTFLREDVITGTAGANDLLAWYGWAGPLDDPDAPTVSDFETVQFGWLDTSDLADVDAFDTGTLDSTGIYDAVNTTGVDTYIIGYQDSDILEPFGLINLTSDVTVQFGDESAVADQLIGPGLGQNILLDGAGTLNIVAISDLSEDNFIEDAFTLSTVGFSTINADIVRPGLNAAGWENLYANLQVDDAARTLTVTGGNADGNADLFLNSGLNTELSRVSFSGFAGEIGETWSTFAEVGAAWNSQIGRNAVVDTGGGDFYFDLIGGLNGDLGGSFGQDAAFFGMQLGEDADYVAGPINVTIGGVIVNTDGNEELVNTAAAFPFPVTAGDKQATLEDVADWLDDLESDYTGADGVVYTIDYSASYRNDALQVGTTVTYLEEVSTGVFETVTLDQYEAFITDFSFTLGAVAVSEADAISGFVTEFEFFEDADSVGTVWQIDHFNAFQADNVTLSNASIIDLTALGVTGPADLSIEDAAGWWGGLSAAEQANYGGAAANPELFAPGNTVITSAENADFTIVLTGVLWTDLSNENFAGFA